MGMIGPASKSVGPGVGEATFGSAIGGCNTEGAAFDRDLLVGELLDLFFGPLVVADLDDGERRIPRGLVVVGRLAGELDLYLAVELRRRLALLLRHHPLAIDPDQHDTLPIEPRQVCAGLTDR